MIKRFRCEVDLSNYIDSVATLKGMKPSEYILMAVKTQLSNVDLDLYQVCMAAKHKREGINPNLIVKGAEPTLDGIPINELPELEVKEIR